MFFKNKFDTYPPPVPKSLLENNQIIINTENQILIWKVKTIFWASANQIYA